MAHALDSLVSAGKISRRHAVKECADCHSRGSTGSTGSIRPGQERAKVVEHCIESEKSLNAPVHSWEERGGCESGTFLFLLSIEWSQLPTP